MFLSQIKQGHLLGAFFVEVLGDLDKVLKATLDLACSLTFGTFVAIFQLEISVVLSLPVF